MFARCFELARHGGIVLAHVRNAARGGNDDDFGVAKLLDKTWKQRESFVPVAGVDMHLATAGLAGREVNGVAEALEHAHDRLACGGEQGVVVAGDEERDAQGNSFGGRISIQILFHNAVSGSVGWSVLFATRSRSYGDIVGPNPFLGLIYHWIGGFASATNFIPFRKIRRWSWEVYWIIQGFAAWIVAPIVLASIFVPHVWPMLGQAYSEYPRSLQYAFVFGVLWGVGGITFGLAIRYLGIALGYAIALGLCAFFGTLVPPFVHRIPPLNQREIAVMAHATSGKVILLGVVVCVLGVAVNGAAGYWKERELTPEAKSGGGRARLQLRKGNPDRDSCRLHELVLCLRTGGRQASR